MIIESVLVRYGQDEKLFSFFPSNNLIHSATNSCGKTTLVRILLYSLGYNVPGTKKFSFEHCHVECSILLDSGRKIVLSRECPNAIVCSDDESETTYCLPYQLSELHAVLFNTYEDNVLKNLLGVFYLDQEKGWTLLNRGTVIGSNHFNVEELIQGLSGRDCTELKEQEKKLVWELSRFQQIFNVVKYKESLETVSGSMVTEQLADELDVQISQRKIELNNISRELKRLDSVIKDNVRFKNYIEEMKILVETPDGNLLPVTSDNIYGLNDNLDFLTTKRKHKTYEFQKASTQLKELIAQRKGEEESELFKVESIADVFDQMVSKFPYGYVQIDTIISRIKKELTQIRQIITDKTKHNNEVVTSLANNINKYAFELDLGNDATIPSNYLFTSNLKILTGAILHKTVFCFRLAYIIEVKKMIGVTLPIILDSPSGKELDIENVEKMMTILNRDFSDHQVIIASIYDYNLPSINRIELNRMLMADADE